MAWAMCARATYDVMCRHLNYPDPALAAAQAPQRVQRSRKRAGSAQGGGVPAGRPVRKRCRLGSEPDSRHIAQTGPGGPVKAKYIQTRKP